MVLALNDPLRRDVLEGGRIDEYVSGYMADVVRRHTEVSRAPNAIYASEHPSNEFLLGGVFSASSSGMAESARQACARMLRRGAPGAPPGSRCRAGSGSA